MDLSDTGAVTRALGAWAAERCGPGSVVTDVRALGGHSAWTYAFVLAGTSDGAPRRLVLRLTQPGAARGSSADALRVVPLLRELSAAGLPVPAPRAGESDPKWFGTSFTVVDHVEGRTLPDVFDPGATVVSQGIDVEAVFGDAVEVLGVLHRRPVPDVVAASLPTRDLPRLVDASLRPLSRSPVADWVGHGQTVHALLRATLPTVEGPVKLVHNDFYSNNWLVDASSVVAVLDWESSVLSRPSVDLGWLVMMYDESSWGPTRRLNLTWSPPLERLLGVLDERYGNLPDDLDWYRALAGYRLACGTAHYLALHRDGERDDAAWEHIEDSVPAMLTRAEQLLAEPTWRTTGGLG